MAVRISSIHFCVLLLGLLSWLTINIHAVDDILETTVVDENNKDIKLKWVRAKRSFLANQNLPIWNIWGRGKLEKYFRNKKEPNHFFDYTPYHDFDKLSAVIYVEKFKCLFGVIDTRYSIECLPIFLLHQKHRIVKNRFHEYIIQTNADHCDNSCYNNPSTITNLFNPSSSKSSSILPTDSETVRVKYGKTNCQSAPNLDLNKRTNINLKELPSTFTSFKPDCSLANEHDSPINPSFPNSESSIIHHEEASLSLSSNLDHTSELANSRFPSVSSQFSHSVSSLPSDSASSSNPPAEFIDSNTALSDKYKSSNPPQFSNPETDLLSDSDSLNIDPDDTFFQPQQILDLSELSDTDLEWLSAIVPSKHDSNPSINPLFPVSNLDLPDFSESSFINNDATPSLLNPQSPINLDFSALTDTVNERYLSSTADIDSPPMKRPRIVKRSAEKRLDTVYPEILVFISHDIVNYEKNVINRRNHINWIVYRLIAYFNAVDMLFAQLAKHGINIHLNIAGIIIEKHPNALKNRFCLPHHFHVMDKSFLKYFQQLIRTSRQSINIDSFDFFHFATITKSNEGDHNYGFSTEGFSTFKERSNMVCRKNMNFPGSIVTYPEYIQNYVVTAREIAHLMEVDYEVTDNISDDDVQCHGIMQKHNIRCLKWSDKSIESFKKYLSKSLDRCFLLNHPKSLFPSNKPVELISPSKMCTCYAQEENQHSEKIQSVAVISGKCTTPMVCFTPDDLGNLKKINRLPVPIDGTKCGENKVCFKKKCVETAVENQYQDS